MFLELNTDGRTMPAQDEKRVRQSLLWPGSPRREDCSANGRVFGEGGRDSASKFLIFCFAAIPSAKHACLRVSSRGPAPHMSSRTRGFAPIFDSKGGDLVDLGSQVDSPGW